jgi:hypothetical protein
MTCDLMQGPQDTYENSLYGEGLEAARDGRPTRNLLMVGRASVPAILKFSC